MHDTHREFSTFRIARDDSDLAVLKEEDSIAWVSRLPDVAAAAECAKTAS
jgi:hypothetical protein